MSAPSPPPVDALEPQGWSHNEGGEIIERRPQSKGGLALFKHARSLQPKDVWRTRVEVGGIAFVGFATEKYNAEKHRETYCQEHCRGVAGRKVYPAEIESMHRLLGTRTTEYV